MRFLLCERAQFFSGGQFCERVDLRGTRAGSPTPALVMLSAACNSWRDHARRLENRFVELTSGDRLWISRHGA
jgi:hypothetical protein